jgi:hypothetical protein
MFSPVGKARESENCWNIRPRARRRKILQVTGSKMRYAGTSAD